ncbi:hypothetical protein EVJ58_g1765 [Rhodofomes roseus]|uniref:Uncharacterized protein n=1 Tax=Rhodofomes roseus TaxID=34475 RepID=A0A4Y9YX99_9APHY|nr:hypothetical protein EVJ58_g1765 [Rhodofomes roseus]
MQAHTVTTPFQRCQLPPEGRKLRKDFEEKFKNIDPSKEEADELYDALVALGLPWFTRKKHTNWLEKWRKKRGKAQQKEAKADSVYRNLSDWLSHIPDPTWSMMKQWAESLHVGMPELMMYMCQINEQHNNIMLDIMEGSHSHEQAAVNNVPPLMLEPEGNLVHNAPQPIPYDTQLYEENIYHQW